MIAATPRRAPDPTLVYRLYRGHRAAVIQGGIGLAIFAVGVYGLIDDAQSDAGRDFWHDPHAAFGISLCAATVARFFWGTRTFLHSGATRAYVRELSRMVYLMLYCLMAVQLLIDAATAHHGAPRNFRAFLIYGLLALLIIRVLGALGRGRSANLPESRVLPEPVPSAPSAIS